MAAPVKGSEKGRNLLLTQAKKMLLSVDSMDAYMSLFGFNDQNVALIEQECGVTIDK